MIARTPSAAWNPDGSSKGQPCDALWHCECVGDCGFPLDCVAGDCSLCQQLGQDRTPYEYEITVAGIIGNPLHPQAPCQGCEDLNGTFRLPQHLPDPDIDCLPQNCQWSAPWPTANIGCPPGSVNPYRWRLRRTTTNGPYALDLINDYCELGGVPTGILPLLLISFGHQDFTHNICDTLDIDTPQPPPLPGPADPCDFTAMTYQIRAVGPADLPRCCNDAESEYSRVIVNVGTMMPDFSISLSANQGNSCSGGVSADFEDDRFRVQGGAWVPYAGTPTELNLCFSPSGRVVAWTNTDPAIEVAGTVTPGATYAGWKINSGSTDFLSSRGLRTDGACVDCPTVGASVGAMYVPNDPCPPVQYRRGKPVVAKGRRRG